MHVAARAEIAAIGQEDDSFDVLGVGQRAKRVAEFGVGFECERIFPVGPVELNHRDGAVHAPKEIHRFQGGHCGHASPSQSLRNDFSLADKCSASRMEMLPRSSSTQRSCAAAISANAAWPLRVSLMKDVRRSPSRCERTTMPSETSRSTM